MRRADSKHEGMFSQLSPEAPVTDNHPLNRTPAMMSEALEPIEPALKKLYSQTDRPSITPERPIRALLMNRPAITRPSVTAEIDCSGRTFPGYCSRPSWSKRDSRGCSALLGRRKMHGPRQLEAAAPPTFGGFQY